MSRPTTVRVREGSALSRLLARGDVDGASFSERLHSLAERLETLEELRDAIVKARKGEGGE